MKSVTLHNGVLMLRSEAAKKMVDDLVKDGLLWEYLSALLDERASGVSADRLDNIDRKLNLVTDRVESLVQLVGSLSKAGVVANVAATPVVDKDPLNPVEKPDVAQVVSVSTDKITKDTLSIFRKMGQMTKTNK